MTRWPILLLATGCGGPSFYAAGSADSGPTVETSNATADSAMADGMTVDVLPLVDTGTDASPTPEAGAAGSDASEAMESGGADVGTIDRTDAEAVDAAAPYDAPAAVPDAHEEPPATCQYPSGRFALSPEMRSDSGWIYCETALDTTTGLTWLACSPQGNLTIAEAEMLCTISGPPSKSWRLPTEAELLQVLLPGCNPTFSEPFQWFGTEVYFTADPSVCVSMLTTNQASCAKASATACVAN